MVAFSIIITLIFLLRAFQIVCLSLYFYNCKLYWHVFLLCFVLNIFFSCVFLWLISLAFVFFFPEHPLVMSAWSVKIYFLFCWSTGGENVISLVEIIVFIELDTNVFDSVNKFLDKDSILKPWDWRYMNGNIILGQNI